MPRPPWPKEAYIYAALIVIVGCLVSAFCAVIAKSPLWGAIAVVEFLAVIALFNTAKMAR